MTLLYPSAEFDDAVAAVCNGQPPDEQLVALNGLLLVDRAALDEYLLRLEVHSRLASDPDLFASSFAGESNLDLKALGVGGVPNRTPLPQLRGTRRHSLAWAVSLAACFVLLAVVGLNWLKASSSRKTSSIAVAVLSQAVAPRWSSAADSHAVGAALEPGWLRLKSGMIQVTFYGGVRLMIQGPAEVQLVSPGQAFCQLGRVVAAVPPQGRGFRIDTPQVKVTDLGTEFGVEVTHDSAQVHVFKGEVEYEAQPAATQNLKAGMAVVVERDGSTTDGSADVEAFAGLFDLERKWLAALAQRFADWHTANARINRDPSLILHFDFDELAPASEWTLPNVAGSVGRAPDATIVGGQATEGRWPGKRALDFRSMNDRVLLAVPGEFQALTLSAWVNVQGLDRQFNSLFMCDGFYPGTFHWQIRNSGALDLGIHGTRLTDLQVLLSPPVIGFNQFGQWLHLATVIDGKHRRVTHFVNGTAVSRHELTRPPPFRIGTAELGNWNPGDIPKRSPFLIRHFSGAMDEFSLFGRALSDSEVQELYSLGKPQRDF